MQNYLEETDYLDFNHTNFTNFLKNHDDKKNTVEQAVSLYEYVRDYFLYDPYHLDLRKNALTASTIILKKRAWCVEKSIVLCASFRKHNIPARLGFAVVTNHIGVEKLNSFLKRPEIVFHGFVEAYLNDKWVKCTPAFDRRICNFNHVEVLNWDGQTDSLFQEFTKGQKYMTYEHFYGVFEDMPLDLMNLEMKKYYPHLFENIYDSKHFSFRHNL